MHQVDPNAMLSESEIIFEEGTEVIVDNKRIGIIESSCPTSPEKATNRYLVKIGTNLEVVSESDIVSAEDWSKMKLLATCDASLFCRKMVHKKTSKILFFYVCDFGLFFIQF